MKDILKEFGRRVRDIRKEHGLSQEELAEKADLHFTYIGGIERGERNLSLKNIKRIADALKIDIRELFTVEETGIEGKTIIGDINRILADKNVSALRLVKLLIEDVDKWLKEVKIRNSDY
ncbi:MAG: helix-turn-helix transcriptional regulator [Deltaproteobacteria bacterium]|nr:helix-turn-helix transcriptional regulator [Deltaproteobacteria bacterium]